VKSIRQGPVARPEWLPTGTAIVFCQSVEDPASWGSRIIRRSLETGEEEVLVFAAAPRSRSPLENPIAISPDGKRLAFTTYEHKTRSQALKLLPLEGGDATELFRVGYPEWIYHLEWTPGGTYLLLERGESEETTELWRITIEGGEPMKIELDVKALSYIRICPQCGVYTLTARRETPAYEVRAAQDFASPR
jgi:hypothetical protein